MDDTPIGCHGRRVRANLVLLATLRQSLQCNTAKEIATLTRNAAHSYEKNTQKIDPTLLACLNSRKQKQLSRRIYRFMRAHPC